MPHTLWLQPQTKRSTLQVGFDANIDNVRQAEAALQAQRRRAAADARQLRGAWRALWTPGRIVLVGLFSGFVVGRSEPLKKTTGAGVLRLLKLVSALFAAGGAQAAVEELTDADTTVAQPDDVAAPDQTEPDQTEPGQTEPPPGASATAGSKAAQPPRYEAPETFRDSGQL